MMSNKSDFVCIKLVCYMYIIFSGAALQLLLSFFWDTIAYSVVLPLGSIGVL